MHAIRCTLAEWAPLRARLLHTTLGAWLATLAGAATLAALHPWGPPAPAIPLWVGTLGAALVIGHTSTSTLDRGATALALTHPAPPLALAAGRVLGAAGSATATLALATLATAAALGLAPPATLPHVAAGAAAALAAAGAALAAASTAGRPGVTTLFLYMLVAGGAGNPIAAGIAPNPARYAVLAAGDVPSWLHAAGWALGGTLAAALALERRRPWTLPS